MQQNTPPRKTAFFGSEATINRVYGLGRREQVAAQTELYPVIITQANLNEHAPSLQGVEAVFSTWTMPELTPEQLERLPHLAAVFYAAGSVQHFARPFLERGIRVVSAWQANAISVAEFTLAQTLLSAKGGFRNMREFAACALAGARPPVGPGSFEETVAVLGAGAIGTKLIELLKPFDLRVVVFDPFLTGDGAQRLGVEQVGLEEAFARGIVVTNHLANNSETKKMLGRTQFSQMREGATFINTGRGATVDEAALVAALTQCPSLTALLDVTDPEPPPAGSPLYALPNVHLTSHIAGADGNEVVRMADFCLRDFAAWHRDEPLCGEVTLAMLETMA